MMMMYDDDGDDDDNDNDDDDLDYMPKHAVCRLVHAQANTFLMLKASCQ
uniref:Uncharacterized protein n=1 Tax=Anguilla anguilla TaxID=7936 RepID=A0A0E9S676_ANGAN